MHCVTQHTTPPRMDLNTQYISSGKNPQNYLFRDDIEYFPKIRELREHKKQQVDRCRLHPPLHMAVDLTVYPDVFGLLQTQFEAILVDPPWMEYHNRAGGFPAVCGEEDYTPWSIEEIMALPIRDISAYPSFCFLWCGNKHVEQATACLVHWGFRRIEDIVWLKTNNHQSEPSQDYLPSGASTFLKSTKEHLLVGIKGSVNRSHDSYLIHANVDDDLIVDEQPIHFACTRKPQQVYDIIERFCNGNRRLELFGMNHNLRPGWVTVGRDITLPNNYSPEYYNYVTGHPLTRFVPPTPDIDKLRPKSPRQRPVPN
jgi:mRNA m6A methyltransferase non-catalytic subunit